jgi:hypothetical protein
MLHMPNGETLQWTLTPDVQEGAPHIDRQAAANLLAEIYDFICKRWGASAPSEG